MKLRIFLKIIIKKKQTKTGKRILLVTRTVDFAIAWTVDFD